MDGRFDAGGGDRRFVAVGGDGRFVTGGGDSLKGKGSAMRDYVGMVSLMLEVGTEGLLLEV